MKAKHKGAYKTHAIATLEWCGIPIGANFYSLKPSQVDKLIESADQDRYQKPANANGSRARYYHARLQRHATIKV